MQEQLNSNSKATNLYQKTRKSHSETWSMINYSSINQ